MAVCGRLGEKKNRIKRGKLRLAEQNDTWKTQIWILKTRAAQREKRRYSDLHDDDDDDTGNEIVDTLSKAGNSQEK